MVWLRSLVLGLALSSLSTSAFGAAAATGKAIGVGLQGTFELGLSGLYDFDTDDETVGYIDVSLGYFLFENIAIGLDMMNGTTQTGERDTVGLFGEYDVANDSAFIPFVGGGLHHTEAPTGSDGEDGRILSVFGGLKLAATRRVGMAFTFKSEWATHPVLGPKDERKKRNRDLQLSLRFYF